MPDLWERLFVPGYVPPEEADMDGVSFPSTDEEFDMLMLDIEAEEAEAERQRLLSQLPGPGA